MGGWNKSTPKSKSTKKMEGREEKEKKRYSSCRYNERQLIDVTVVRRVRPRAEHNVRTYRFLPADTRYIRIFADPPLKPRLVEHTHKNFPPLKPRLFEQTHRFFFRDVAIRNSLRSNKKQEIKKENIWCAQRVATENQWDGIIPARKMAG